MPTTRNLASTLLMATDTRVLLAPAMNVRMWENPANQRNLETLRSDGMLIVGPDDGAMACGEFGPGRMAEVPDIVAAVVDDGTGNAVSTSVIEDVAAETTKGVTNGPAPCN